MEVIKHAKTYVAFLDVLGFRELVKSNNHDVLTEIYQINIADSIEACRDFLRDQIYNYEYEDENVNVISVSDSIILWTKDESQNAFVNLLVAVKALLYLCMLKGVPLRGAITDGPLTVISSTNQLNLVGEAITKAYALEQDQDWSGCVISDECLANFNDVSFVDAICGIGYITKWPVPKKSGEVKLENALVWIPDSDEYLKSLDILFLETLFGAHSKRIDNWATKRKIDNTFNFIKHFFNDLLKKAP